MGAGLSVFTPFYTMIREARMSGIDIDLESLIEYTDRFSVNYLSIIYDRFDYFDNIISGYWTALNNQNLTSLFGVFLQPFPRGLWPDKPYNFSTALTALVYPDNIAAGVTGNFGFISEFVYYFGWIGFLLRLFFS